MYQEYNKKYISEENTELCVMCNRDTKIPVDKHIEFRNNYIEGLGQLCYNCNK